MTLAYKTKLLSSLIPIRYEDTIDGIEDLDKSGLPLIMAEGGSATDYIRDDPREVMIRIFNRSLLISMPPPKWAFEMYESTLPK